MGKTVKSIYGTIPLKRTKTQEIKGGINHSISQITEKIKNGDIEKDAKDYKRHLAEKTVEKLRLNINKPININHGPTNPLPPYK